MLPSFPLPTLPDAPSKADLAMQGLDDALVEAELISPSQVLQLPPDEEEDTSIGLSSKMRRCLKELGIQELFAVQTRLLPFLLGKSGRHGSLYMPYNPPRDVCVSAPTGSGKTLAYAIPIVELLSTRVITRLRALIILPTRDLVSQVRETLEAVSKGRGLKIGIASGQHSFSHEQSLLIANQSPNIHGGSSKVDILICTPGRLMDHLNATPNFSLQHLRFLVIDEADRLLAQSFQDWLTHILAVIRPPRQPNNNQGETAKLTIIDSVSPAYTHTLVDETISTLTGERKESSCQKLLFSATLTRDPGKIAGLELRHPKYFVVQERKLTAGEPDVPELVMEKFTMPTTLKEHMIICESSLKPLIFFYLIHVHSVTNALVFTKSAESTLRLVHLLSYFEDSLVAAANPNAKQKVIARAYSSDLPIIERRAILEKFKTQQINILICSDLISRGIDIDHVSHVVSYDTAIDMRKYVHRAGRTARAGRSGNTWTLVEEQEARYFKQMLRESDHLDKVKRLKVTEKDIAPLVSHYEVYGIF
ncbi:hypothetical protein AMATHDRAFT_138341 [Amanita thiersii Skay4041]|uniref:ATP-dependent RNA helicase n=1 Tax=Amanita thiersii Skay4041 TaxID=703135 RepID=A0A2A9NRK9_9AGAR|nr:hypothetical protein AMATHDRAFT_138341 [Amanita thiersii Skay4041]